MNKILLIIQREYLTRVKKKSFLILTFLTPLLFAAMMILPAWLAVHNAESNENILVIDRSGLFAGKLNDSDKLHFSVRDISLDKAKENFYKSDYTGILYIPHAPEKENPVLYFKKQPSVVTVQKLENRLENVLREQKLRKALGVSQQQIEQVKADIHIRTVKRNETGSEEAKHNQISMALGMFLSMAVYFFIFMYGVQVMRGVIEEKTNRIVEIIVSSVKPFQLMLGKIIGIALVGLTQLTLWVVLTMIFAGIGQSFLTSRLPQGPDARQLMTQMMQQKVPDSSAVAALAANNAKVGQALEIIGSVLSLPWAKILFGFIFFFLFGYLLYAALFAAIGSAVDTQEDTQQFIFPVTLPLILSIVMMQFFIMNPDSQLAVWMSIFPLTSPIVMMLRIPFGVPWWQIILAAVLLVATFLFMTWLAGKIYRTGILMYGKKASYKELWKWLRY